MAPGAAASPNLLLKATQQPMLQQHEQCNLPGSMNSSTECPRRPTGRRTPRQPRCSHWSSPWEPKQWEKAHQGMNEAPVSNGVSNGMWCVCVCKVWQMPAVCKCVKCKGCSVVCVCVCVQSGHKGWWWWWGRVWWYGQWCAWCR